MKKISEEMANRKGRKGMDSMRRTGRIVNLSIDH
jgi:hypothetical protein